MNMHQSGIHALYSSIAMVLHHLNINANNFDVIDAKNILINRYCRFRNYCDVFINANNATGRSSQ